jgi:hypothetical protein
MAFIPGSRRRKRALQQDQYAAELRQLQLEAMKAVMAKARQALEQGQLDVYQSLSSQVFEAGYLAPGPTSQTPELLTPHERRLDAWRIVTTIVLVAGLLVVVGLILFTKTSTSAATPFISLVSGLAGIALGWMFAGAGNTYAGKRIATKPKRPIPLPTPERPPARATTVPPDPAVGSAP